jgi:hypothetical protein
MDCSYKTHLRRTYLADDYQRVEDNHLEIGSNLEECNIRNGTCSLSSEEEWQNCTRLDNRHENITNSPDDDEKRISEPISKMEFILCTLLFNRINLVLLAGIVNILLLLKLDNLFGQVI